AFAGAPSHPPVDVAHLIDTPEACQDLVDHAALPDYFAELRHMPNDEFLRQYNTEAEMKRAAEGKNAELMRELEDIRAQFSGLKGMSEGLKHGVEHGRSQLELESIEAYDLEAEAKFVAALQSLKDLKFSLLDQLEGLKD
nr:hypothetical protein [Tanacetum cinerariifolium]